MGGGSGLKYAASTIIYLSKKKEKDAYKKKYLVTHYLMSKGFEQDLIQEALSALISNEKG